MAPDQYPWWKKSALGRGERKQGADWLVGFGQIKVYIIIIILYYFEWVLTNNSTYFMSIR